MMTTGRENSADQQTIILRLLEDEQVLVHITPTAVGVLLPEHLRDSRTVTLRLSRYFKGELLTDETRISAELLFGNSYFRCEIPWNSIWGASSIRDEEFLWPEVAPPDILELALAQQKRQSAAQVASHSEARPPKMPARTTSHLRRVK